MQRMNERLVRIYLENIMRIQSVGFATILLFASMSIAQASVMLTDIQSFSDGGGVWNNDNTNNWAIWVSPGAPQQFATPTDGSNYLNNNGGSGHLPNTPVTIPQGTTSYALYRGAYASTDVSDKFIFGSQTLTISPNLPYIASSSTAATGTAGPILVGTQEVSISGFGWYAPGAYNIANVGDGQALGSVAGANLVGVVTFFVTPEPSTFILCGLGTVGLFIAASRRRRSYSDYHHHAALAYHESRNNWQ